ncbi:YgaP family membrane protein [Halocola ammonii]
MKINMGKADRVIRFLIAVVASVLYFTGTVSGLWGVLLLIVGAVMLLTSLVGLCPLYSILGVKTCSTQKPK